MSAQSLPRPLRVGLAGASPDMPIHIPDDIATVAAGDGPASKDHSTAPDALAGRKTVAPKKRKSVARGRARNYTIEYTDDMTDAVMSLFLGEALRGTFRKFKGKGRFKTRKFNEETVAQGFERISQEMSQKFPNFGWNAAKIKTKFETERQRLAAWLAWRDGYYSAPFDDEGRPVSTEEQHRLFLAVYPEHDWVFSQALRDVDGYLKIYPDEEYGLYAKDAWQWLASANSSESDSPSSGPPHKRPYRA
ncbi:hypothetical protein SEPCBS57363_000206 [Sporothrix epigloea]|uniref:Myb/SANT-like domain-containing protein n=1 Tax=Sporothrix epigloea TaxID=1892477 RepID=A0ABP0D6M5_9PEZI